MSKDQSKIDQLEHEVRLLSHAVEKLFELVYALRAVVDEREAKPSAPVLIATFTSSGDPTMSATAVSQAALIATLPATRADGSALDPTDIASITFQKAAAATPTAQVVLATNTAASAGAGLTPAQIAYVDTTTQAGDIYTAFITDTDGNVSAVSNTEVAPATVTVTPPPPPVEAAPSPPTLSATFS